MLFLVLALLIVNVLSADVTIATMNLALGGTKYTKYGSGFYWIQEGCMDRTVFSNLYDMAHVINTYNIDIIALQELDVTTDRIQERTSDDDRYQTDLQNGKDDGIDVSQCPDSRDYYDISPDDPAVITAYLNQYPPNEYIARYIGVEEPFDGEYGNSIIFNTPRFVDPFRTDKIKRVIYQDKGDEYRGYIAMKFVFENTDNVNDDKLYQLWFVSTHLAKQEYGEIAMKQLDELMDEVSTFSYPTIICGDFNLNYDNNMNQLNTIFDENGFENIFDENEDYGTFPKSRTTKLDYCLYKDDRGWFDIDMDSFEYLSPWNDKKEAFTDHWGIKFSLSFAANN